MQVWALASGSSGNCYLLESEGTRLLVECGRPLRDVLRYLTGCGVDPSRLDGIVVTHAHSDHVRSARDLSDRYQLPVYASAGTLGCQTLRDSPWARPIQADQPFQVGEIEVHPFAVPHDCAEPLAYRFESHSGRAAITTDLGWVPDSVRAQFVDLQLLVLEANYDPYMLETGRYPAYLKRRVAGSRGHLSNGDAAEALTACGDRAPERVWLAHISEHNNHPGQAQEAIQSVLRRRGLGHLPIQTTRHRKPSLHWDSAGVMEQLVLF